MTIGEEILLLMLDYDTGRMNANLPARALRNAVSGALLMDLAINDRIDTDLERLVVVNPAPLHVPVLDQALERIAKDPEPRPTGHWVEAFAEEYEAVRHRLVDRLVARRVVVRRKFDQLLVMGTRHQPGNGARPARDARQRIAGVLLRDEIPAPRDVMIISIADSCDLWPGLIDPAELPMLEPKIRQIARMDLIGQAVARAIHRL